MVFFRADANYNIGMGHIMRCLSIADAFVALKKDICFVLADDSVADLVNKRGYNTVTLHSDYTKLEDELPLWPDVEAEMVIVDSYYVTKEYFNRLSSLVKTVYIDDLNADTWNVDALINYNIYGSELDYSSYEGKRLLLGPSYAPLRKEFQGLPKRLVKDKVSDVLVSVGGADPHGLTERFIAGLCGDYSDIRFHFIIGALNPRIDEISDMVPDNAALHINETDMAGLMLKCDVAIAAAGSTLYELCACGTPTITYSLADNQLMATESFEKKGIMLNVGDCRDNVGFIDDIKSKLDLLIQNVILRKQLSERMQDVVDGKGAQRIVEYMIEL